MGRRLPRQDRQHKTGSTRQEKLCTRALLQSPGVKTWPCPLEHLCMCVCEGPCMPAGLHLGIACRRAQLPARGTGQPRGLPRSVAAVVGDDSLLMAISSLANFSAS